ncbi:ABC transporter, putative [Angomonas deanei]|uniref:ABC transporter, putative n=1 Tax=Angomonas deanei TaxID=59799 RepID=A0A7G2CJQ8_9TRYP|nr:ABC transporter, putative [Angomonas deanei]
MTALVGHSGGGKSTLVHLLLRLYDPQEGEVLLDDTPLQSVDLHWYHNNVAVVAQDTQLFNGTVADNIQYGLQNVRVEDLHTAAKEANAYDFIMDFPEQFDTLVGENGVRLSGGQRQRIAIARALLRKPKILFLDEATSALDAESEVLVQAALDSLVEHMQHCTVIIIAHRLSTIRKAHRIVVVGDGAVAEEGTHDELLSRNGVYARLIAHQLQTGGKTLEFDGEKEDKEEKGEDE